MSPRRTPPKILDSPTPSPASECAPSEPTGGGGGGIITSPLRFRVGSQFRRLEKKLSTLPTLW